MQAYCKGARLKKKRNGARFDETKYNVKASKKKKKKKTQIYFSHLKHVEAGKLVFPWMWLVIRKMNFRNFFEIP